MKKGIKRKEKTVDDLTVIQEHEKCIERLEDQLRIVKTHLKLV